MHSRIYLWTSLEPTNLERDYSNSNEQRPERNNKKLDHNSETEFRISRTGSPGPKIMVQGIYGVIAGITELTNNRANYN